MARVTLKEALNHPIASTIGQALPRPVRVFWGLRALDEARRMIALGQQTGGPAGALMEGLGKFHAEKAGIILPGKRRHSG